MRFDKKNNYKFDCETKIGKRGGLRGRSPPAPCSTHFHKKEKEMNIHKKNMTQEPQFKVLAGLRPRSPLWEGMGTTGHSLRSLTLSAKPRLAPGGPSLQSFQSHLDLKSTGQSGAGRSLPSNPRSLLNSNEFFEEFLKAKGHLGTSSWTKNMSNFLLGSRNGISIVNLEYTFTSLRRVLKFLENMTSYRGNGGDHKTTSAKPRSAQGFHPVPLSKHQKISSGLIGEGLRGQSEASPSSGETTSCPLGTISSPKSFPHILFVNTCSKYSELVKQTAIKSNQSYINERWIGGTLTNWKQISESILLYNKFHMQFDKFLKIYNIQIPMYQKAKKRYEGLNKPRVQTESIYLNKKESQSFLSSEYIPDIIILTNPDQNNIVIQEAQLFKIPVIAFCDTNTKTIGIDYIIPGNNKSIFFMYFCLNLITITLQKGAKPI